MSGPVVFCLDSGKQSNLDGKNMRLITFDPGSAQVVRGDDIEHSGQSCCIKAMGPFLHLPENQPDLELILTEFPDPNGEFVYFIKL